MPTNIAVPIYACNICGTPYKQDLPAAEACEAGGPPAVMAPGQLLLEHTRAGWEQTETFRLRRLYPVPGSTFTVYTTFSGQTGHYVRYWLDVDPAEHMDPAGFVRAPLNERGLKPREVKSNNLHPAVPGALQIHRPTLWDNVHRAGLLSANRGGKWATRWVAEAFGLRHPADPDELHLGTEQYVTWFMPLTPEVQALCNELEARIRPLTLDDGNQYSTGAALGAYAASKVGDAYGRYHSHRVRAWLAAQGPDVVLAEVNDLQARWLAGEPVAAPRPWVTCRRKLFLSKLTKRQRDLVAAVGVPWPERTDSTAYLRSVLDHHLAFRLEETHMLFPNCQVVAVTGAKGGVGKSTTAAALARHLAATGRDVVLVDCDLTGPSQHVLFGLGDVTTDLQRALVLPAGTDQPRLRVFSPGQLFGPADKGRWTDQTIPAWLTFLGTSLDVPAGTVVVLDLPPGDNAVHAELLRSGHVNVITEVHVTTASALALADTERGLGGRPGKATDLLVETMAYATGTIPGGLGHTVTIRLQGAEGAAPALAERCGLTFAGSLPWQPDPAVLAGTPQLAAVADRLALPTPAAAA